MDEITVLNKIKEYESVFGEKLPKITTSEFNFASNYVRAIDKCISENKTMTEMGWGFVDFFQESPPHRLHYDD